MAVRATGETCLSQITFIGQSVLAVPIRIVISTTEHDSMRNKGMRNNPKSPTAKQQLDSLTKRLSELEAEKREREQEYKDKASTAPTPPPLDCREVLSYYITKLRTFTREFNDVEQDVGQEIAYQTTILATPSFTIPSLVRMLVEETATLVTLKLKRNTNADVPAFARAMFQ